MNLIKSLSSRVDREQTKKLQELGSGSSAEPSSRKDDFMSFGTINDSRNINETGGDDEDDFEKLVLGKPNGTSQSTWNSGSASSQHHAQALASSPPVFSWSTTSNLGVPHQSTSGRTITPDLASFAPFAPAPNPRATPLTPPLQPGNLNTMNSMASFQASSNQPSMRNVWTNQQSSSNHSLPSLNDLNRSTSGLSVGQTPRPTNNAIAFGIPPPPLSSNNSFSTQPPQYSSNIGTSAWSLPPPPGPGQAQTQVFSPGVSSSNTGKPGTEPKSGLDAYQSLL
jgi:SCY1-like protein 2